MPPREFVCNTMLMLLSLAVAAAVAVAAATQQLMSTVAAAAAAGAVAAAGAPPGSTGDGEDAIRRGAAAYSQLLRESTETDDARGCWQHVAEQLLLLQHQTHEDACSVRGEAFRELIALTRMRCIYTRSHRSFPGPQDGCYLFPEEVPEEWLKLHGSSDPAAKAAAIAAGLPPEAADHPCVQLHGVLLQLQQMQQLQEVEWQGADDSSQGERQHEAEGDASQAHQPKAATPAASAEAVDPQPTVDSIELMYKEPQQLQALHLRQLHQLHQHLRRSCNALTLRQAAACQQQDKMEFGTFALVREQINHIDNICFFLHSAERQRRSEETAARLSAASAAAATRVQDQLRQLQHMEQLQQHLQLQQLQGGSYIQQLLQQIQQAMEDTFALLQQLKAFHRAVGEWLGGTETFVVYGVAALVTLVVTASSRVAAARLKVLGLIFAAAALEIALHHSGLSPYLSALMQHRKKRRDAASVATWDKSATETIIDELVWGTAEAFSAGVAVHGVSLVRWVCLLASCWLWTRCVMSYISPEQQLQQQLQQLQLQVSGVRNELHQAQQAGDPRMQEVQQLLQQLLNCVVAKDSEMWQFQQQQQYSHQLRQQARQLDEQCGTATLQPGQPQHQRRLRRSLGGYLLALSAAAAAALLSGAVAVAVALAIAVWGCVTSLCRLWWARRAAKTSAPRSSSSNLYKASQGTCSQGRSSCGNEQYNKREAAAAVRQMQPCKSGLTLPAGLRQQSRKNNEDEGEEADPTYQPSSSSCGSCHSSQSPSPSQARCSATESAGPAQPAVATGEQQQTKRQRPLPQPAQQQKPPPLRRNPPRKCRIANYAKIDEPQHPEVFMREVVPPQRLKALQRQSGRRRRHSSTESSSSSPATTPKAATPLPKSSAARSATMKQTPTPVKKEQQQQQQQQHALRQQDQKGVAPPPAQHRARVTAASK
ncbi:hypothetical protein Efla_003170 [Eimeria flavescens]